MNAEQIQAKLIEVQKSSKDWEGLRQFMLILRKEDSDEVLQGLLNVFFIDNTDNFRAQACAGGLLWKLKPKYKRNLREDILRSFENWDVSIEELPWYFAELNGIEKVRETVNSILLEPDLEDLSRRKAETYLYWLSVSDADEFRDKFNREWNGKLRG